MKNRSSNLLKGTDKRKQRNYLFRDFSIRIKLIVLFFMISIIPLIIITTRDTFQTQKILATEAEISLKAAAAQTANSMDAFIFTTLDSIAAEAQFSDFISCLTLSPATPPIVRARAQDLLNKLRDKSNEFIVSYALVDKNGMVLLDTVGFNVKNDESKEPYFSPIQVSNEPIVTAVTYSKDKIPTITFASKVVNINGEYIGILRASYDADILQDVLTKNVGTVTDASVLLLDDFHIRMADSRHPDLVLKSIVPLDSSDYFTAVATHRFLDTSPEEQATNNLEFQAVLDNVSEQPFFRADINPNVEGDDTASVAFMNSLPWIITYSRPTSVFLADAQRQIRINIILVLGMVVIIVVIIVLVARSFTNPITALAKVANLIEQGDLNARAQVQSKDEIGMLSGSFNLMTNQLQEMLHNLERRVTERTAVAESARVEAEIATAEARAARKEIESQIWLATGQTQLADAMRGEQTVLQLAGNVISQLSQYVGAQAGALFLLDKTTLTLAGSYAFGERDGFDGSFQLGEGVVGQAAADGVRLLLETIPPDAMVISTGLVHLTPRQMLAVPFYANKEVVGVFELATLSEFTQVHFDLLDRISESTGVAFRTVQTRLRLAELLMESQQQAEELQAQDEELRAANEELLAQAETLKASGHI